MKAADLRNKTVEELRSELAALEKQQFNERFTHKISGNTQNTANIRKTRRDIARVNTVLTEKLRAGAAQE